MDERTCAGCPSPIPSGSRASRKWCEECARREVRLKACKTCDEVRPIGKWSLNCRACQDSGAHKRKKGVAVEVWAPPIIKVPGRRWLYVRYWKPKPKHPRINGSRFVCGRCHWCEAGVLVVGRSHTSGHYCSDRCAKYAKRSKGGRFLIAPKRRLAIYERDNWTCQLCLDPVDSDLPPSDVWAATLDHIIPQSHASVPDHSPENLQLAHRWCNSVKGDESYHTADVLRVA